MKPDLAHARVSGAQRRHLTKDQYKCDHSDVLICTPGSTGASGEYARLWRQAGKPVYPGRYAGNEVVFVTTNGRRRDRKSAHLEEIQRAAAAGCTLLTDGRQRRPEGGNAYNTGEQEVADFLRSLGYTEREEFGGLVARWSKDNHESLLSLPASGSQHSQEIVMIRLHASFARKVPGEQQYSSDSVSASVEVELPEGANIPNELAKLWDITRGAVEQQLGQRQSAPPVNRTTQYQGNGHNNGDQQQAPSNGGQQQPQGAYTGGRRYPPQSQGGNGRSKAAISDKQKGFVKSLIGELGPLGVNFAFVEALCQRLFQRGLDYLDRAQASTLIGHLSEIKAGRVTVEQLVN